MSGHELATTLRRAARNLLGRPYAEGFFAGQAADSRRSASIVVPHVMELVEPQSVVDVGCGVGTWLAAFREAGVDDLLGLDGDYVPRDRLEIAAHEFRPADLSRQFDLHRRFDLVVSLEVAEHLPRASAEGFVASLAALADVALFSAAVPRQHGSGHINEQWQSWWARLFARHGFVAVDALRRRVWHNPGVEWWYQQNMLLYVAADRLRDDPRLRAEREAMGPDQLSLVHPALFTKNRARRRVLLGRQSAP